MIAIRPNTPPLTVETGTRLERRMNLVRGVVLRFGIRRVRLSVLHLLLVLVSWWTSVCKVGRRGNGGLTKLLRSIVLTRDGCQMRDWFLVQCGVWVECGSRADLVVRDRVSRLSVTPCGWLVGVVWLRRLVVKCGFASMTILTRMWVGSQRVEDHALKCQLCSQALWYTNDLPEEVVGRAGIALGWEPSWPTVGNR